MKINLMLLSLFFFVVSCSLLSPGGTSVKIVDEWGEEQSAAYKKVGEVNCRSNLFLVTRNVNMSRCKDVLRNGAYELKADIIYVDQITPLGDYLNTGYDMRASAYKTK